jgi:hypothetical protein
MKAPVLAVLLLLLLLLRLLEYGTNQDNGPTESN